MQINQDNYRSFPAISNSDLGWLEELLHPVGFDFDKQQAFDDGNLVDAVLSEHFKVDYFRKTVQGVRKVFTDEKIEMVRQMKKSYDNSKWGKIINAGAKNGTIDFQKISYKPNFKIQYDNFLFEVEAKCKWDIFWKFMPFGGDFKSTAAETQKQFEEAFMHFGYPRSRAWYMDLEDKEKDIVLGISKKNYKIFEIQITRGDELYSLGKKQYQEIAFKYNYLFGDMNNFTIIN